FAREHECLVVHDLAYADLCFDGYAAPSFLQAPGAKDVGVEFFTLTKSYNMPGWRVGFMVGNREIVAALARVKSYLDYGIFQPVQIAATHALNGPQHYVQEICETYRKRRNVLCDGLDRLGWHVPKPKATMFVWAEIPDAFKAMGSLEFSKLLLREAKIAVSPGIGFGEHGDHYVRFALIENEHRTRQAVRGIRPALPFVLAAIRAGKDVVTANKALLAVHGEEIVAAAEKQGVRLAFEASVGGGIPILRTLKEGLAGDRTVAVYGIVNGTCNHILTT